MDALKRDIIEDATWSINCGWVPGTSDRVRLGAPAAHGGREIVIDLTEFRRLAGRAAVDRLYLEGRAHVSVDDDLWLVITRRDDAQLPGRTGG